MILVSSSTHVARKAYYCDAYEWLDNCLSTCEGLTFSEKRELVKMIRQRGKILPGQQYIRHRGKDWDDNWYTYRANPVLHAICLKLDIYEQ